MTYSLNGNGCHEEIGERIRSTIYNLSILPRSLAASAVLNIPFEISGHRKTKVGGSGCVADQERAHRPGDDIKIDASFAMGKAQECERHPRQLARYCDVRRRLRTSECCQGGAASHHLSYHHSLYVGSAHPPHTQGKVQSAVSLALSGIYLLQTEALIGLMERQTTSKVPVELILPIMAGFDRW